MQRDPIPVRERTRRTVRSELAQLAADGPAGAFPDRYWILPHDDDYITQKQT